MKKEKYVVLGEKRNGKFYKSEEYKIDEFISVITKNKPTVTKKKYTLWDRIIGIKKTKKIMNDNYDDYFYSIMFSIGIAIIEIINNDKKGKKIKKVKK